MCICIIIISFIISCLCTTTTKATTTGTVYLQSNKSIFEKGEEIEIVVFLENAKTVSFSASLYFDNSKLEYISDLENTNIVDNNHIVFVWYDITGGNNPKEKELIKFRFRAKENGVATFNIEGEFYDEERELMQIDFKDVKIQIGKEEMPKQQMEEKNGEGQSKGDNATLEVLRLDKEGMIPSFNKNIYDYYLTVSNDIDNIEVFAISENQNASIEIVGNNNLKEGLNIITINVISEDRIQNKIYTIQVTKTNNIELANTNLEILAVENILLNPPFDTNITHYSVEISNDISNLNILAIPQNESAKVEINGKDNLKEGNNIIKITVTAPNGISKKVFEIDCYKRNYDEEKVFQEEQKVNKEKLEQIYENEKISEKVEDVKGEKFNVINIVLIVIVTLIIAMIIIGVVWRKKHL